MNATEDKDEAFKSKLKSKTKQVIDGDHNTKAMVLTTLHQVRGRHCSQQPTEHMWHYPRHTYSGYPISPLLLPLKALFFLLPLHRNTQLRLPRDGLKHHTIPLRQLSQLPNLLLTHVRTFLQLNIKP